MTGLNGNRVYLDWNATAPLRPEARQAMLEAMDVLGNPSSVHAEGRAAKAIIEKSRGQVAKLVDCTPDEVIFTSGATEAIALGLGRYRDHANPIIAPSSIPRHDLAYVSDAEHDAVHETAMRAAGGVVYLKLKQDGSLDPTKLGYRSDSYDIKEGAAGLFVLPSANGETGVVDPLGELLKTARNNGATTIFSDIVQLAGKRPFSFRDLGIDLATLSGHKFGSPKGVGALLAKQGHEVPPSLRGGGQERGARSGTENAIGIAGIGAAAEAASHDLQTGIWEQVEKLRNILEEALVETARETIFFGQGNTRLPNTSCFAVPGWAGETQVMQMDLAGFAVSAGSACSSGKVKKASRVLLAMGFDEATASSAIRVSMGPTTTEAEVMAFADAWKDAYRRRKARAA